MNNDKRTAVALIWGGRGYEREVSRRGREHILPLIDKNRYRVLEVFIDKDGRWLIDGVEVCPFDGGFFSPDVNKKYEVDCAIPLLHGDFGEDGRVQGALDCADIKYLGCDTSAGAICRDKALVKMIATSLGIPTLPFLLVLRGEGIDYAIRRGERALSYPMFVKPATLGSSIGANAAYDNISLRSALTEAFGMTDRVIIEECLTNKRELECGYLSTKCKEIFTSPGEILCNSTYGYNEKYLSGDVGLAIRSDVSDSVRELVREYSRRLVRTLGIRDLCRIDFFLSGDRLYFNEINTMPGFTEGSLFAKMLCAEGVSESGIFSLLIEKRIGGD